MPCGHALPASRCSCRPALSRRSSVSLESPSRTPCASWETASNVCHRCAVRPARGIMRTHTKQCHNSEGKFAASITLHRVPGGCRSCVKPPQASYLASALVPRSPTRVPQSPSGFISVWRKPHNKRILRTRSGCVLI